jgi:hypothetical protein
VLSVLSIYISLVAIDVTGSCWRRCVGEHVAMNDEAQARHRAEVGGT